MPNTRLAEPDDVELYLRTQGTVSAGAKVDETLLERMLDAASRRMIRARPERTLYPRPAERTEDPVELRFSAGGYVQIPDLRELVSIRFDERAPLGSSQYRLIKRPNEETYIWVAVAGGVHHGAGELVISGYWGPEEVDPDVFEACVVWVARVFHQRTARFADNTQTPDGGALGYFRNLPPDVKVVLDALQIPGT